MHRALLEKHFKKRRKNGSQSIKNSAYIPCSHINFLEKQALSSFLKQLQGMFRPFLNAETFVCSAFSIPHFLLFSEKFRINSPMNCFKKCRNGPDNVHSGRRLTCTQLSYNYINFWIRVKTLIAIEKSKAPQKRRGYLFGTGKKNSIKKNTQTAKRIEIFLKFI